MSDRDTSPHVFVVGPDPTLREEFSEALGSLFRSRRPVLHYYDDYVRGVEAARSRRPRLFCVEVGRDVSKLTSIAEEVVAASADTTVAAVYRRDSFADDDSEGTFLIEALRGQVQDFLRRPLSSSDLEQLLDRVDRGVVASDPSQPGKVISFISNKGGVGKSTLAVNTACTLARRHPDRVLLVDASLQLGVCSGMLNVDPSTSIRDAVRERHRLDESLLKQLCVRHDCGLHLLAAPADAIEASEVDEDAISRILTLARRAYDFVVVDTFPLLDSVVMAMLDLSDLMLIVFQGTVPNVIGTARLFKVLDGLGYAPSRWRVVLNHNIQRHSGSLRRDDIEERLGRSLDYMFPYKRSLLTALNVGVPYVLNGSRFSGFRRTVRRLAQDVENIERDSRWFAGRSDEPNDLTGAEDQR